MPYIPYALKHYTPVFRPMPASEMPAEPDESPTVCIEVSEKIVPYLLGLLEVYRWRDNFYGEPNQIDAALGVIQSLMVMLMEGNCALIEDIRIEDCELQVKYKDQENWLTVGEIDDCAGQTAEFRKVEEQDRQRLEWKYTDEDETAWRLLSYVPYPRMRSLAQPDGSVNVDWLSWLTDDTSAWATLVNVADGRTPQMQSVAISVDGRDGFRVEWKYTDEDETAWRVLGQVLDGLDGQDGADGADGGGVSNVLAFWATLSSTPFTTFNSQTGVIEVFYPPPTHYEVNEPTTQTEDEYCGIATYLFDHFYKIWSDILLKMDTGVSTAAFATETAITLGAGLVSFGIGLTTIVVIEDVIGWATDAYVAGRLSLESAFSLSVREEVRCNLFCALYVNDGWSYQVFKDWVAAELDDSIITPNAGKFSFFTMLTFLQHEGLLHTLAKIGATFPNAECVTLCDCGGVSTWSHQYLGGAGADELEIVNHDCDTIGCEATYNAAQDRIEDCFIPDCINGVDGRVIAIRVDFPTDVTLTNVLINFSTLYTFNTAQHGILWRVEQDGTRHHLAFLESPGTGLPGEYINAEMDIDVDPPGIPATDYLLFEFSFGVDGDEGYAYINRIDIYGEGDDPYA